MKPKKLLWIAILGASILPFHIHALETDVYPITREATDEEYHYLVDTLGFDRDYINILPKERITYLVEHAGPVETETKYYKTYENVKNVTGFSKNLISDSLVGTTVELTKEQYYQELNNQFISTYGADIQGRYDSSYRHINISTSKIDSTTAHYLQEVYWDILPSRRDIDYLLFTTGSPNAYGHNFYSAQLFSQTTAGSYTNTTSVHNDPSQDNITANGGGELEDIGNNYSKPIGARYNLVNDAKAIKLIQSFDIYNLPSRKVISTVYLHNISGTFNTSGLLFKAESKTNPDVPNGPTVNVFAGNDWLLNHFDRQTYMLASI